MDITPKQRAFLAGYQELQVRLKRAPTYQELIEALRLPYPVVGSMLYTLRGKGLLLQTSRTWRGRLIPRASSADEVDVMLTTTQQRRQPDPSLLTRTQQAFLKAHAALMERLGRAPTRLELAMEMGLSRASISLHYHALRMKKQEVDFTSHHWRPMRRSLDEREKTILELRLQNATLEEISQLYGITRERVRQIEVAAERRMGLGQFQPTCRICGLPGQTHEACRRIIRRAEQICPICKDPLGYDTSLILGKYHIKCRKVIKHCKNCGKEIVLDITYDRSRFNSHARVSRETGRDEDNWYCSRTCFGQYMGRRYGFAHNRAHEVISQRATKRVLAIINAHIEETGTAPTLAEFAIRAGGIGRKTAWSRLNRLLRLGEVIHIRVKGEYAPRWFPVNHPIAKALVG